MRPTHSRVPWFLLCAFALVWLPGVDAGEADALTTKKLTADGQGSAPVQITAEHSRDEVSSDAEVGASAEVVRSSADDVLEDEPLSDEELAFEAAIEGTGIGGPGELRELVDELDAQEPPPLRDGVPVGKHTQGYLLRGRDFPIDDDRFTVIAPWRAYCAQDTIDGMFDAVDAVESLYPGSHAITVGDCSRKGGGPLSPHMSHQTGLDIDIGPYWADGDAKTWLEAMHPHKVDIPRTWALIEALVSDERVKYIILDYRLQQMFYEYAEELPWMDEEYLDLIFQYPRGEKHFEGIIRHWQGHYSHMHVRFHCPEDFADTCVE